MAEGVVRAIIVWSMPTSQAVAASNIPLMALFAVFGLIGYVFVDAGEHLIGG